MAPSPRVWYSNPKEHTFFGSSSTAVFEEKCVGIINQLAAQWQIYWQIPGFRMVLGVLLLAGGIIYLQFPESRMLVGFLLIAVGLFILFHGVSAKGVLGSGQIKPDKPAPIAVKKPKAE